MPHLLLSACRHLRWLLVCSLFAFLSACAQLSTPNSSISAAGNAQIAQFGHTQVVRLQ